MEISENLKLPNANSLSSSPHHSQAFVATGFNIIMNFDTSTHFNPAHRQCDFDREVGKVSRLLFSSKFLFSAALFPISMGSGQTTRASSPSSEHQILKKNIGGEFQSFSPLLLFPKSGCYTHPPPSLLVQLLSAANEAFSHKTSHCQSPPLSKKNCPRPLPIILPLTPAQPG